MVPAPGYFQSSGKGRRLVNRSINSRTQLSVLEKHGRTQKRYVGCRQEVWSCVHSPWRKEMTSGSAKFFGFLEIRKKAHGRQQSKRLWRFISVLAVGSALVPYKEPLLQGDLKNTGEFWSVGVLVYPDHAQAFGDVAAVGPGLSALISSFPCLLCYGTQSPITSRHLPGRVMPLTQLSE